MKPRFDGATYNEERDGKRLGTQFQRVRELVADGKWRPLFVIAKAVGGSPTGVSARLRDLRKRRFGGHKVECRHVSRGRWEYRVLLRKAVRR